LSDIGAGARSYIGTLHLPPLAIVENNYKRATVIRIENVRKELGGKEILSDISFEVNDGEVVGFLGPNGAGKTTTLRILSCFFRPTSGRVLIGGLDVTKSTSTVKRFFGYLPEQVPFYGELTVKGYLEFVAEAKGMKGRKKKEHVSETMALFGLLERSMQTVKTLSKGYQKRVCLAQALINDPKLLLLDEPTNSLDPQQIVDFRNYIKTLSKDRTIFLSSHILAEVKATCEKVIIINNGRIKAIEQLDSVDDLEGLYLSAIEEN
jgi:gliding motility-associated transport system ATP-binding protein